METTNKKMGYGIWAGSCVVFFFLGYLLYPQINTTRMMNSSHQMPDGSLMRNDGMPQAHSTTMRQMMDDMNKNLEGKTGNEFDEAFLEEMIPHHQGAVTMADMALTASKRPEIIALAKDIIASQQKEIEQMRAWQKAWFGVQAQ